MKRTGIITCLFALLLAYAAENAAGHGNAAVTDTPALTYYTRSIA